MNTDDRNVRDLDSVSRSDIALVGGKNASLGEMVRALGAKGVQVPPGFATTAHAYRAYLAANDLGNRIADHMARLSDGKLSLHEVGTAIRKMIVDADWPRDTEAAIVAAYRELGRTHGHRDARRRRPFQRDRRGSAGCQFRRPARDVPECPRREGALVCLSALLCLAFHGSGDHLPPDQGLRS